MLYLDGEQTGDDEYPLENTIPFLASSFKLGVSKYRLFDDSTSFDIVLKADSAKYISEGYRVQILATRYFEYADSLAISISSKINDSVYVEFETPNYKVRVGDFINRDSAELLQKELLKMGYKTAWILRTRITAQRAE